MRVLVLGATGGTGMEIVRQGIARGHSVTAFVRSPEKLGSYIDLITVKQGNLLDTSALRAVTLGQDAVLSAFGPRLPNAPSDKHLLRDFAVALSGALPEAGVKRVILESSAFLFKDALLPPTYLLGKLLFPTVVADATDMETIVQKSELEWTLLRPPRLIDGRHTGRYRVREGHLPPFGFSISRADVADCFLRMLDDAASSKKIFGVSS
jgi:putative NADH-flavin reductase